MNYEQAQEQHDMQLEDETEYCERCEEEIISSDSNHYCDYCLEIINKDKFKALETW